MLELRDYQRQCLDELGAYLRVVGQHGAKAAFVLRTERPYREAPHLPGLPYVCIRVPTGGGKTLMACHAVGIAAKEFLQAEQAVVLWLVPSNAIREQTLKALRDRRHPYREQIDADCGGRVTVMDLREALSVRRGTLGGDTCIIVSTLAALRVEDTEGRKFYEQAGALEHHFSGLPEAATQGLERYEPGGAVIPSLANVLKMHKPLVIMDEAHNARTKLSFETLERFSPSCIIEFTATPQLEHDPPRGKFASNVLAHVSAAELKNAEMIKLPIRLHARSDWRDILSDTVRAQKDLEDVAKEEEKETGEYIRPIVLLQSQPHREGQETITAEVVKKALLETCKVPEERVAVATGETREIKGVDLFKRDCPIRFIITQQALKEGWDCSFAYIFCSVADIGSARDVEQLVGRVLRLPGAKSKQHEELNRAYAMVSSAKSLSTMGGLREALFDLSNALIANGFEAIEAREFVTPDPALLPGMGPLFSGAAVSAKVPETPDLSKLDQGLRARVGFDESAGTLTVAGPLTASEKTALQECFAGSEARQAVAKICEQAAGRAAAGPKPPEEPMKVPALGIRVGGLLERFEDSHFLDVNWSLAGCDTTVPEELFPSMVVTGADGELDISRAGRVEARFVKEVREQLALLHAEPGWTLPGLVNWVDCQILHRDLTRAQATLYLYRVIEGLMESRGLTVEQLAKEKVRLAAVAAAMIEGYRRKVLKESYDRLLFGEGRREIETSPAIYFLIGRDRYAPNWYYDGQYQFRKDAIPGIVGELKSEGEEFECAQYIDQMPQVKRWVRNLANKPECSFFLWTSTDRFYPDFVAELADGRFLVVEYKRENDWSNDDSREKRAAGELWADRSGGRCLFVMPKGKDFQAIESAAR